MTAQALLCSLLMCTFILMAYKYVKPVVQLNVPQEGKNRSKNTCKQTYLTTLFVLLLP